MYPNVAYVHVFAIKLLSESRIAIPYHYRHTGKVHYAFILLYL